MDYVQVPTELFPKLEELFNKSGENYNISLIGRMWGRLVAEDILSETIKKEMNLDVYKSYLTSSSWQIGLDRIEFLKLEENEIQMKLNNPLIKSPELLGSAISGLTSEFLGTNYNFSYQNDILILTKKAEGSLESVVESPKPIFELKTLFEPGESYLIIDDNKASITFEFYKKMLEKGFEGICITTMFPPKVEDKHGINKSGIIWLTDYGSGKPEIKEVSPKRLDFELSKSVMEIVKQENSVIMLHGLEYLISNLDYDKVLKFVQQIRNKVESNKSMLLCPIDPDALDKKEYVNLKLNFTIVGEKDD